MAQIRYIPLIEEVSGKITGKISGRIFNGKNFSYTWDREKHPYQPTLLRRIHLESVRLTNLEVSAILQDPEQAEFYRSQALAARNKTGLHNFIFRQRFAAVKQNLLARFANDELAFNTYLSRL